MFAINSAYELQKDNFEEDREEGTTYYAIKVLSSPF
jgi:hypothetical protein